MDGVTARVGRSLEPYCAVAFLIAGGFWLVDTALFALGGVAAATNPDPMVTKLAAVLASVIGILGLYPRLADRNPRTVRVGAVLLVFAGIASIVLGMVALRAGAVASLAAPPAVTASIPFVPLLIGLLLYGKASIHGNHRSRVVGLLLLIQFGVLTASIPAAGLVEAGLVGVAAVTLLTAGFRLHTETEPATTIPDAPLHRRDDV